VAKNYDVTNKITNLENGYWGIMAQISVRILRVAHPPLPHHEFTAHCGFASKVGEADE